MKKFPLFASIGIALLILNVLLTALVYVRLAQGIPAADSWNTQTGQISLSRLTLGGKIMPQLAVKSMMLNGENVQVTFCNKGNTDVLLFPARIRVNGIKRDFEIGDARAAHACATHSYGIDTWGLSFEPGSTLSALAIIDPDNIFGGGNLTFPSNGSTFTVPVYPGPYLSVRSILVKTSALQATFCNLGTVDLPNFPARITLNGIDRSFDIPSAYKVGTCATMSWPYTQWGIPPTPGTTYTATILLDPNNTYQETNKYDDAATITGTP